MKDPDLWAFDLQFWLVIVFLVWLGVTLTACSTLSQPREIREYSYTACDGRARTVWVREYIGFPPTDCPIIAAQLGANPAYVGLLILQFPLACALYTKDGDMAWVVLAPGRAFAEREYGFVKTRQVEILPILEPNC